MRGAKLLRSGWMSPRDPLRRMGSSVARVEVKAVFCPLGTMSDCVAKSKVDCWLLASLMVLK